MRIIPPRTKKIPYSYEVHGYKVEDGYHWLRDKEWPKVKEKNIITHLKQENTYTENLFSNYTQQKDMLFKEMKSRIKLKDQSPYVKKDDYYYYTRSEDKLNYAISCRKHGGTNAKEEVILDVNHLAKGHRYTQLGTISVSPDHKLLGYSIDHAGNERYQIIILDLKTNKSIGDVIDDTIGPIIWHEKLNGFFYTPTNEQWRQDKIMFHKLGDDSENDKLIYHEKNPILNVGISKSSSKKYLFVNISGHDSNEAHYIKMTDNNFDLHLIQAQREKIEYDVDHGEGDEFYIHVNDTSAQFRIVKAPINNPSADHWSDYINANDDYLQSFDITQDYLILNYKKIGLALIQIIRLHDNKLQRIEFPDHVYSASAGSSNYEENDIRVGYSSLKRPATTYLYDFEMHKLSILKEQEIPCGFSSNDYGVERVWADNNGTQVPVSVLYKKSLFKKNGESPLYLHAYGSYGIGMSASFRSTIFSLVDRGVIFALAHIRGGDDLGFEWYESAKFLNKKKTFEDFICCGKKLIEDKFTSEGNIIIMGGSAGGLVVGNAINTNPEMFKGAVAHVPFVDLVSTMLDETLPLTPGEFKEWGNPKEKKYFDYMMSYSPYDNVKQQNYPSLYVTAGLSDPRVGYWEAAKWVAKLREHNTGKNKIYLKTNMNFGHSGASGRFDYLKEIADDYIFILSNFKKI